MKILVTGASGFIGSHFALENKDHFQIVTASVRSGKPLPDFSSIDAVVHLGGVAHQTKALPDEMYFDANATLTKQLALAAKQAGVSQFVFASSVKVYGDDSYENLTENSACHPTDAYGKSKLMAELFLKELADERFIISIIRIPLVYGAGVKGNMLSLLKLAQKSWPLPFQHINNKRSLVYIGNLIALINTILKQRAGGIFIAGDTMPLSTTQLVLLLRQYSGRKKNLFAVPVWLRYMLRKLHYPLYIRLFGSFFVDNSATNQRLQFRPPFSTEEGIENMVKWYKTISP